MRGGDSGGAGKKFTAKQREAGRRSAQKLYSEMRKAGVTGGKRRKSDVPF